MVSAGRARTGGDERDAEAAPAGRAAETEIRQLSRLQLLSLIEGATLILLVFVCMPLKHFAGLPLGSKIMGPVHGLAFLAYVWTVVETVSGGGWKAGEIVRLVVAAFVPFGTFANHGLLTDKRRRLSDSECDSAGPST